MKKIFLGICAVILLMALCIVFGRNLIAKAVFIKAAQSVAGLKLEIRDLDIGLFRPVVKIEGVKVFNPKDFPKGLMCDVPEIYLDYDLGAFLQKRIHLKQVRLNVKEVTVAARQKNMNVSSLKALVGQRQERPPEVQIDSLELKFGRLVYNDYSAGAPPKVNTFVLNMDERIDNIPSTSQLIGRIMLKTISYVDISQFANMDFKAMKRQNKEALQNAVTNAAATGNQATSDTKANRILQGVVGALGSKGEGH